MDNNNQNNNDFSSDNVDLPLLKNETEENNNINLNNTINNNENSVQPLNQNINELDNPYFKVVDNPIPLNSKKEINNNTKKIITIILGVLTLALFLYNLIAIYIIPDTKKLNQAGTNNVLSSENTMNLLSYVPILNNSISYPGAYKDSLVTIKDINNYVLLNEGLSQLKNNKYNFGPDNTDAFDTFKSEKCTSNDNCYTFTSDKMSTALTTLYGSDLQYTDIDFMIGASETDTCFYGNGTYMCKESMNKSNATIGKTSELIGSKEMDNKDIIIYEKALFVVGALTKTTDNAYNITIDKIYKYNMPTVELDSNVSFTSDKEDYSQNLITKYENYIQLYKHTFKKGSSGNYYWYSTEPVSAVE
jgi:hypothetical protein